MDINKLWSQQETNKENRRSLSVNTILAGKYLVGPVLGQGGFGITYKGYDLNLETYVAIKEYFPVELVSRDTSSGYGDKVVSLSGEKGTVYRQGLKKYMEEAQHISRLQGIPGIISVKDFFYENETAYIVMEYIDGVSLKEYLDCQGGRIAEEEALQIMKPVLEGLEKVHMSGLIHRDISPDNIMLILEQGKVKEAKLIDFGAARMTEKNDQKSLTIILKHGYAPEEQYRTHGEQGSWTDVYAVCAVLYRMVTGNTPVPAMDRLFQDSLVPLKQANVPVNKRTALAVEKGLAVKREDRIQTVQELLAALYGTEKIKAKPNRIALFGGLGGICMLALAVLVIMLASGKGKNQDTELSNRSQQGTIQDETEGLASEQTVEIAVEETKEDELGEEIVEYMPQKSIGQGINKNHLIFCKPDGTVIARGSNEYGQCDVESWNHIVAVAGGVYHSLGLRADGTTVAVGDNGSGACNVEQWENIVDIEAGASFSMGVTAEGNVLVEGAEFGMYNHMDFDKIAGWTDIKSVEYTFGADAKVIECVFGLKKDGSVIIEGEFNGEDVSDVTITTGWENVEKIIFFDPVLVGIEADGTVHASAVLENEPDTYVEGCIEFWENLPKMKQIDESGYFGVSMDGDVILFDDGSDYNEMIQEMDTESVEFLKDAWTSTFYFKTYLLLEDEINAWTDMVAVHSDNDRYVYGISQNGEFYELPVNVGNEIEEFQDLVYVDLNSYGLTAQKKDGSLLYYGSDLNYYKEIEKEKPEKTIKEREPASQILYLYEDGTMEVLDPTYSYQKLQKEKCPKEHIVQIESFKNYCVFLMEDGTVQTLQSTVYETGEKPEYKEYADQIKNWKDITYIWSDYDAFYGLQKDGTILAVGEEAENWSVEPSKKMYSLSYDSFLGLTENGTVKLYDNSGSNNINATGMYQVESWTDIIDVAIGDAHTVGLKADGTVVAVGKNHCGQCDVEEWKDIVSITAYGQCTAGITSDGELLMTGTLF